MVELKGVRLMQPMSDVSSSSAIHVVAHWFNMERYHLGQAKDAGGLLAVLSKLGNAPNESYLNPVRTLYMVSSRMFTSLVSTESLTSPYQES